MICTWSGLPLGGVEPSDDHPIVTGFAGDRHRLCRSLRSAA
jgi:hypothetical protein